MLTHNGKKIKIIYLAGKMSGLPDWGHKAFMEAAGVLRDYGFEVFNPAETENCDKTKPREFYLQIDFDYINNVADAVVVLSDWKVSEGAKSEVRIAQERCKPVYNYSDFIGELPLSLVQPITEKVEVVVSDYVLR